MIVRIGRMIAYQEYNTKSPLNGLAAKWAAQNAHLLPIDVRPIAPPFKENGADPQLPSNAADLVAVTSVTPEIASQVNDPWTDKIVIESKE